MALEQRRVDRFVDLAGIGLSIEEASLAAKISERSGHNLMARPDIRTRVEELRAKSDVGLLKDVRDTIDDLLVATDSNGDPDWTARARGAEMLIRHQQAFEDHDVESAEEALPEGVFVIYPRVSA